MLFPHEFETVKWQARVQPPGYCTKLSGLRAASRPCSKSVDGKPIDPETFVRQIESFLPDWHHTSAPRSHASPVAIVSISTFQAETMRD